MSIISEKVTKINTDKDGNITEETTEKTTNIQQNLEPDFIKLYTKMWCEFNEIPEKWQKLFIEIATRMSYANSDTPETSQTIVIYGPVTESITKACGWKDKSTLRKGLKALCDCGAIKRTKYHATYQVSPLYAGKGEWKYNPKLARGGVEDLVATFKFKNKSVKTEIVWADDGSKTELNEIYRKGLEVTAEDQTVLKTTTSHTIQKAV